MLLAAAAGSKRRKLTLDGLFIVLRFRLVVNDEKGFCFCPSLVDCYHPISEAAAQSAAID